MSAATKIAFLTANEGIEKVELVEPWAALAGAGYEPVLLAPESGKALLFDHLDKAGSQVVDLVVGDADIDDYAALVLPGGVANPDALRLDDKAVSFVRDFIGSGKPVAAICHAAWVLVEAGVLEGRTLAAWPSLQTDIRNAGGTWVDKPVVTDGNLISSRNPDDISSFNTALLEALGQGAVSTS